jgi:hypothetical protein
MMPDGALGLGVGIARRDLAVLLPGSVRAALKLCFLNN